MTNRQMTQRATSGFTLVEILVVIAIIGLLTSLLIPAVMYVREQANRESMKTQINAIKAALEQYNSEYGDYPPSSLEQMADVSLNDVNNGSESLTACLMSKQTGDTFLDWPEQQFQNYDQDSASKNITGWFFGDNRLREMVDMWQYPIIYVHHRDYGRSETLGSYRGPGDIQYEVKPAKSSKTNAYHNPTKFQVWSIGPDGKNQNGDGDDIATW